MHGTVEYISVFLASLHSKRVKKKTTPQVLLGNSFKNHFFWASLKNAAPHTQNTLARSHKTAKRKHFRGKVKRFRRTLNLAPKPASVFPWGSIAPASTANITAFHSRLKAHLGVVFFPPFFSFLYSFLVLALARAPPPPTVKCFPASRRCLVGPLLMENKSGSKMLKTPRPVPRERVLWINIFQVECH